MMAEYPARVHFKSRLVALTEACGYSLLPTDEWEAVLSEYRLSGLPIEFVSMMSTLPRGRIRLVLLTSIPKDYSSLYCTDLSDVARMLRTNRGQFGGIQLVQLRRTFYHLQVRNMAAYFAPLCVNLGWWSFPETAVIPRDIDRIRKSELMRRSPLVTFPRWVLKRYAQKNGRPPRGSGPVGTRNGDREWRMRAFIDLAEAIGSEASSL